MGSWRIHLPRFGACAFLLLSGSVIIYLQRTVSEFTATPVAMISLEKADARPPLELVATPAPAKAVAPVVAAVVPATPPPASHHWKRRRHGSVVVVASEPKESPVAALETPATNADGTGAPK